MHHPASAAEALGRHADTAGDLIVETVRSLHERFAEAHLVSRSRYGNAFGAQWRDLLDDVADAFQLNGYRTHRLMPAGYKLPVVNDRLVYVWRVPESSRGIEAFASSPTRVNSFMIPRLPPMLFDTVPGESDTDDGDVDPQTSALTDAFQEAAERSMPLVLVAVHSSPLQLRLIEWGVAELNPDSGEVTLHGRTALWTAEPKTQAAATDVAAFDSGVPAPPVLEPRKQEGIDPDAR